MAQLLCSWLQVNPAAKELAALGFSPEDISVASIPITCEVLSSFMYEGECLIVANFDGGVVIDARLVQFSGPSNKN